MPLSPVQFVDPVVTAACALGPTAMPCPSPDHVGEAYAGWHPGAAPAQSPSGILGGTGPRQGPNDPDAT